MTAKIFVKELNASIDTIADPEISSILDKMRIRSKKNQTSYKDELSSLINNYEIDDVEIGMFSFFGGYRVLEEYLLFGKIEMDPLGMDRNSREIVLLDHDNPNYIMLKCAKSSTAFLELLNIYSKFTINRLSKNNGNLPPERKLLYETSGGDDYKQFVDFCFEL